MCSDDRVTYSIEENLGGLERAKKTRQTDATNPDHLPCQGSPVGGPNAACSYIEEEEFQKELNCAHLERSVMSCDISKHLSIVALRGNPPSIKPRGQHHLTVPPIQHPNPSFGSWSDLSVTPGTFNSSPVSGFSVGNDFLHSEEDSHKKDPAPSLRRIGLKPPVKQGMLTKKRPP
ncbi:hypothetical protein NMY22_g14383 [Coprinellus aureogranulatus]|nr:hypothetical protein NMY22_g14383 [Coprinellus aureogranulatus]